MSDGVKNDGVTAVRDELPGEAWLKGLLRCPVLWIMSAIGYLLYSRGWDLAAKVMHHDESLFAYYGYWLYRGNGYDYQPILHGPVLQFVSAFFFLLFGDDQWSMRLPSLIGGLLMFPVAWYWRRYLGGLVGVVAIFALIALSPSLAYYTRFLRNDIPYLTATIWCALCLLRALQTGRPLYTWAALMAATLMFCMMESSIFFFAACIGYLGNMVLVDLLVWRRPNDEARSWPAWLARFAEGRRGHKPLGALDFVLCWITAGVVTLGLVWLFNRVFADTIPVHAPVQLAFKTIGIEFSVRVAHAMIVLMLFAGLYVLGLLGLSNARTPRGRFGLLGWFSRLTWKNRWHILGAFAAAVIIYTTLFTTFFTFTKTASFDHNVRDFAGPQAALTPVQIYKNTWDYWWDQHKLHRIKGPFHYYLPILLLYELPILGLVLLNWLRSLRHSRRMWMHVAILGAMHVALAVILKVIPPIDWEMMDVKFHVTHPAHLHLVLLFVQLLTYIAPMMFYQGRRVESFVTYWGVTSLFAYSYAGEKVPWLTVHTVGPLALLAAFELVRIWRGIQWRGRRSLQVAFAVIAVLAVTYQVRNNHLLLFKHPWSPAERLVYNHTSPDIAKAVDRIREIGEKTNFGNRLPVFMEGEVGWPLHWYLRDYVNASPVVSESVETTTRPVVMVDLHRAGAQNLRENYHSTLR